MRSVVSLIFWGGGLLLFSQTREELLNWGSWSRGVVIESGERCVFGVEAMTKVLQIR